MCVYTYIKLLHYLLADCVLYYEEKFYTTWEI